MKRWLILLAIANGVVIGVMQSFSDELKPYSIIAFEFAATPERAGEMVSLWRQNETIQAVYFLIGFDYLFMITYSAFLFLSCNQLAKSFSSGVRSFFTVLSFHQPAAALLDALENAALFQILSGSMEELWPIIAYGCAVPKFLFALVGLLSAAAGGVFLLMQKK
ncbi:MAG: hypothetical protein L0Y35_01540 [Flammeovirgaceae bacterium]|nr:hypothetical protein [Flammeovirgaceae bacterium]